MKYKKNRNKILLFLFFISLAALIIKIAYLDSDTWFILSTGRYIIENGAVPNINPFTMHEGLSIIIQQWLFDVIIYGLYLLGGYYAIYLYALIAFVVFCALLYKLTGFWSENETTRLFMLFIGCFIALLFATARPTSFTLIAVAAELIILEKWRLNKGAILLWLIPLALVEVNMHMAFYPILFVLALPYLFKGKFDKHIFKMVDFKLLLVFIPMLLAGLVNPYGIRGMGYLVLSYGTVSGSTISELQSAEVFSAVGLLILMSAIAIVAYIYKKKKDIDMCRICMAVGTFIIALPHIRDIWFLIFGILPLLADLFSDLKFNIPKRVAIALYAVFLALFCFGLAFQTESSDDGSTPLSAVEYLDEYEGDIVLFTGFNNGAYLEWCGYLAYIDARPEIYESKINKTADIFDEYMTLLDGSADYDEIMEKYGFTHLIALENGGLDIYLKYNDDYEAVIYGDGYVLYEKQSGL